MIQPLLFKALIVTPNGGYSLAKKRSEGQIARLERERELAITALDILDVDWRLGRIEDDEYARRYSRLQAERSKIEGMLSLEQTGLVNMEAERRWVDWVKAFGQQLEERSSYTPEQRKQYLQGMIREIDVKFLADTNEHELTIEFFRPIVGDTLDRTQTPYVPVAGTSQKFIKLDLGKRQKQGTPVGNYSATVE